MPAPRVLLLVTATTYRVEDFLEAARALGVAVRIGSDRCHVLAEQWGVPLALDFRDPAAAAERVLAHAWEEPIDAVVATDDVTTVTAGRVAAALGLPASPPQALEAARNKALLRERLGAADVPSPGYVVIEADAPPAELQRAAAVTGFPVVVKPLLMSGSRGVIRADDLPGLARAVARAAGILRAPDVKPSPDPASRRLIIETFVPGNEVAVEGLLRDGRLHVLAVFDKPDPLDGPFFEETIYVTPSRLPEAMQSVLAATAEAATAAIGLTRGPVHAELRLSPAGPVVIEVAGRTIGGLCSRMLRFGTGRSLEELVLLEALGRDPAPAALERERRAAGALMIPIPARGLLREVRGIEDARQVPGIEEIEITARTGHEIVPLPEGSSYLGFVFARGDSPAAVELALRRAHARLEVVITPNLAARLP